MRRTRFPACWRRCRTATARWSSTTTAPTQRPRWRAGAVPRWCIEPRRGYGSAVHAGSSPPRRRSSRCSTPTVNGSRRPAPAGRRRSTAAPTSSIGRRRPVRGLRWPWHARLGNAAVCWRLRRQHGLAVHDIAPMRVARREALLALGVDRPPIGLSARAAGPRRRRGLVGRRARRRLRPPHRRQIQGQRFRAGQSRRRAGLLEGHLVTASAVLPVTVLVVAKAPVPGQAKTRLARRLGDRRRRRHRRRRAAGHTRRGGRHAGRGAASSRSTGDLDGPAAPVRSVAAGRFHRRRATRGRLRRPVGQRPRRRVGRRDRPGSADRDGHPAGDAGVADDVCACAAGGPGRARDGRGRRLVGAGRARRRDWPTACTMCRCPSADTGAVTLAALRDTGVDVTQLYELHDVDTVDDVESSGRRARREPIRGGHRVIGD